MSTGFGRAISWIAACGATAAITLAASGCTVDDKGVASIDQGKASVEPSTGAEAAGADAEPAAPEQVAAAEAMVACLKDKGVETELIDAGVQSYGDFESVNYKEVWLTPALDEFYFSIPDSSGMASSSELEERLGWSMEDGQPHLYDNGRDQTDVLVACIDSSGYTTPKPQWDPREEEAEKQLMADASNTWAACARENGLPKVTDAKVEVDNFESMPAVLVDGSVTVDELKAALAKCAPFDPERDLAAPNFYDEGETAPKWTDPSITFDLPEDDPKFAQLRQALDDHIAAAYEKAKS
ncbi:MAG: hypothetical protein LBK95_17895 [Bifidobacteriaceae bacterium]|jgi:hypothetical protein|nr:hypothetical protein [Bifidobacteriaceae bacterium]